MERKAKCKYCGCRYTFQLNENNFNMNNTSEYDSDEYNINNINQNSIDFKEQTKCPSCGMHNDDLDQILEYSINNHKYKNSGEKQGKGGLKKLLITLCIIIVAAGIAYSLALIGQETMDDDYNDRTTYLKYSDELLTDKSVCMNITTVNSYISLDFNKKFVVEGSYADILKCIDHIIERQISNVKTAVNIKDGIVDIDEKRALYVDYMEFKWYAGDSLCVDLDIDIKGSSEIIPSKINFYLVSDEGKIRLREQNDTLTTKKDINTWEDIFSKGYTGEVYLEARVDSLAEYTMLEVVVDENVYQFELQYVDNDTSLTYYGVKENSDEE